MKVSLLGPVELLADDGSTVPIGPGKRRAILAILALEANLVVDIDRILALAWDGNPPTHARSALQGHISALRRLLDGDLRLITQEPGYLLQTSRRAVDAVQFRDLIHAATLLTDAEATAAILIDALALWRGPALADLAGRGLPAHLAEELENSRRDALTVLAGCLIRLDRGAEIISTLRAAVTAQPLHEPLARALMLSLYQADRQAEALAVYDVTRRQLAAELGIDPGAPLREAHQRVLRGQSPNAPGTPATPAPPSGIGSSPPAVAPAQLPRPPSGFTGRTAELTWLDEHVAGTGLALVSGPAGVGKTSLVLRWAHDAADRFADGQLFADLRGFDQTGPTSPSTAIRGFLRALGTADTRIPAGADEQAALFRSQISGRRMLVVLDNAHSLDQVRMLLPGDPRCQVVVTSRHRLDGLVAREGAAALSLAPMAAAEAVDLLARAVGQARTQADPDATRHLAALCDYLPIALRIAAARLTTRPDRTVADLTAELSDEHARLSALATDDADVSVAAALGLTCRILPDAAVRMFTLLGIHPGNTFDLSAASALLGVDAATTRRCLAALAGSHLIQQTAPDRFTRHDLIRLYCRDLVTRYPAEQRQIAEGRLLDYYLQVTVDAHRSTAAPTLFRGHPPLGAVPRELPAFADMAERTAWFRSEEPVIRALTVQTELCEHAWRLANNSWILYNRLASDALQTACMTAGLAAARAAGSRQGIFQMLIRMSSAHTASGNLRLAFESLREGEKLFDEATGAADRCRFLIQYAQCDIRAGDWDVAMLHYREALAITRQTGQSDHETGLLNEIASNLVLKPDPEAALPYSTEAAGRIADLPPGILRCAVLHTHAAVLERLGRIDEALRTYQDALETALALGHARNAAILHHAIGTVLSTLGRDPEAIDNWNRAVDAYHALGMPQEQAVRMRLHQVSELPDG